MRVVMLKGTVHACGPDILGFYWDWDRALQRPVADMSPDIAARFLSDEPQSYGRHPDDAAAVEAPARRGRARKEATP